MKWTNFWKVPIAKAHSQENVCSEKHCTSKKNEFVVKKLHRKRTPGPNGFTGDFSKHFMKKWCQSYSKSFKKYKMGKYFLAHSMRPSLH